MPQLVISCQVKLPVPGIGQIFWDIGQRGLKETFQVSQAIENSIDCSAQTDGKALFLETAPMYFIKK